MASAPHLELDSADAIDGRQIRAAAFQDVRLEYVRTTLDRLGQDVRGRALVVGSGRGLLARGLAGMGFAVTAHDPSARAVELARDTAAREGLDIAHVTAPAEALGLSGSDFDLVYCADTFETTHDLDAVIAQAAAALRPGGVLVYDTVNRTLVSRLIYLGAFQALPMTRIMPPGRYAADRLRTPGEVADVLRRHGLDAGEVCDFKPRDPKSLVAAVRARRQGKITDAEIPPMVDFVLVQDARPIVTYLGYAVKDALPG